MNDHGVVVGLPRGTIGMLLKTIRERCSCMEVFSPTVDVQVEVGELWRRQIVRIHVEPNSRRVAYKGVAYVRLGESDYKGRRNG